MMDMYEMRKAMEIIQNYTTKYETNSAIDAAYNALNLAYTAKTFRMRGFGKATYGFTLDGITYKAIPNKKGDDCRYFKNENGKTHRIGFAEYGAVFNRWIEHTLTQVDIPGILKAIEEIEEANEQQDAPKAEEIDLWGHIYEDANGNRVEVVSPSQNHKELDGYKYIYSARATPKGRADYEARKKKAKKPTKKVKVGGMEFNENGIHVVLTAKQVDFIRHLPDTAFWESGVDSTPWIDCLCDDIGGQFEGKPMTVGAMVSTLREKGLLKVSFGQFGGDLEGKGRKAKFFSLTDAGKAVVSKILNG